MHKTLQYLVAVGVLAVLAGCSSMEAQPASPVHPATPHPAEPPAEPDVTLTPELLYQLLVAEIAGQRGDLGLAAVNYLRVAQATRDFQIARRATRLAGYARAYPVAQEAARLWVELAPADLEGRQSYAALLMRGGDLDGANSQLRQVLELAADRHQGFMLAANILSRDHDKERALRAMEELLRPYGNDPDGLYAYAQLATTLGQHERAAKTLTTLLQIKGDWSQAWVLQAGVWRAQGREAEAMESFKRGVDLAPEDTNLRLIYARVLVDDRRLEEAREQFRILARQAPDNSDVVYALGLLAMEAGDIKEAEKHFNRLLQLRERSDEAAFSLGQIAEERQKWEAALQWYERVSEGRAYLDARVRTAVVLSKTQGIDEARDYLRQVEAMSPDQQVRLFLVEGEILREARRYADAKAVYDEALTQFAGDPELLYARAMVAERLGRIDLLEQDLRTILAQDPDNTQALNALGYTLADRTNRFKEALGYIQRALEQSPEDAAIIDSMGWVLFRMGRHQEALDHLRRAAAKHPDPEIAAHLAEVLWVTGSREEARKVWEEALQHYPDDEILKAVIRRLSQ